LTAEADNEYAMLDSTVVRAHQHSAGAPKKDENQALGRSKGGLSTKIHAPPPAKPPSSRPSKTVPHPVSSNKELYKARHLIENFFCKLKQFRAIATRYDKTARNFLAAIHLAATTIWLI
jgi:hypothetical protein